MSAPVKSSSLQLYDLQTLSKEFKIACSSSKTTISNPEKVRFEFTLDMTNGSSTLQDVQSVIESLVSDVSAHYVYFTQQHAQQTAHTESQVAVLNNKIDTEVAVRSAADLAQTQARVQLGADLQTEIALATQALQGKDNELEQAIADEVTRATMAEALEKADREAAIAAIQASLQFLQDNTNAEALQSIGQLIEEFKAIDATLQSSVVGIRTDLTKLKERFDKLVGYVPPASDDSSTD